MLLTQMAYNYKYIVEVDRQPKVSDIKHFKTVYSLRSLLNPPLTLL